MLVQVQDLFVVPYGEEYIIRTRGGTVFAALRVDSDFLPLFLHTNSLEGLDYYPIIDARAEKYNATEWVHENINNLQVIDTDTHRAFNF
jgi:hypothetical protein